ncbi:MAG: phosphoenolpyruvate carboxylase [Alphaproteobacteria bacterium]
MNDGHSTQDLSAQLSILYGAYRHAAKDEPLANHVQTISDEITRMLDRGDITLSEIGAAIDSLTRDAFQIRADRLGDYLGEIQPEENTSRLHTLFEAMVRDREGRTVPFDEFRKRVERATFGIVFTAHPTFSMSREAMSALADLAGNRDTQEHTVQQLSDGGLFGPPEPIDLRLEEDFAARAIANARHARGRIHAIILDVARTAYPDEWRELVPEIATLASWVGYDLDGRADIGWSDTMSARLRSELDQVDFLIDRTNAINHEISNSADPGDEFRAQIELVAARLGGLHDLIIADLDILNADAMDGDAVQRFNRHIASRSETRQTSAVSLLTPLDRAVVIAPDALSGSVAILRALVATSGLGAAHVHLRLNASQLVNAIRRDVGLEHSPNVSATRRSHMRALNELIADTTPVTSNFGDVVSESASARRLFMIASQILKHIDSETPIRLLIAECESPFEVLTALYFARLFGIEDRLDISPLFETPHALEHGHDMIAELVENKHYRTYIQSRKRLCVQTGFSDAGRFMGQIAASLAIERFRIKLADALAHAGLTDIEVVIFDTHGESVGRGAHPASFADRLDYVDTPFSRSVFANAGLNSKQELSFQGGDGYVFFVNPDIAFATLSRLVEQRFDTGGPAKATEDRFYADTDFSLEFFLAVKNFHDRLVEDPDYAALLGTFATNLLPTSGSRPTKRAHEGQRPADSAHPSQIRAIPNNGILQQLGYLANSVGGLGGAINIDPERFHAVYEQSSRLRSLVDLAHRADSYGSLDAFRAYVGLFDPVAWLLRAQASGDPSLREPMESLAGTLQRNRRHERLNRMLRLFLQDSIARRTAFDELGLGDRAANTTTPDSDATLDLLHAIRVALIGHMFRLVTRVPRFSREPNVTIDDIVAELLQLGIPDALVILERAFPIPTTQRPAEDYGEPSSYAQLSREGYIDEHITIFKPLRESYALIQNISTGITHACGAIG